MLQLYIFIKTWLWGEQLSCWLSSWWKMSGCWNVICHCPFLAALKVTSSVHLRSCVLGISLISAYILWVLARCMILLAKLVGWCWNITPPLCTVINIHSGHSAAPLLVLHRTNFGQVRLTSASIYTLVLPIQDIWISRQHHCWYC